ncbi:RagB/SusD family nutrient uptake outer membrane protein [Pedobacter nyackensis]|uniref:Starch-binding associating with outer membrane n=1 Tax=Pedobacter nyackensis TaxID=475255 RepID=A0A1W2C2J4_9SPHI|nr:RagB/SusD family nutrient uptake outer membrane protein [Pedobacter nyackensis]SMC79326.1 Starch-binding associating with outer membrane [Pedobacter nyackensis]
MNTYIKTISLIAIVFFTGGCKKVLDVKPVSSITSASYWKSEGDVTGYLTGIYTDFRASVNTTFYMEDRGDTFSPGLESGLSSAWQHNLTSSNAPNWINYYNLIHHCNLVIKYGNIISFSNGNNRNRALAEAHFIRAFTYFWLLRSWGDVPIVLEPTESDDVVLPSRAPQTQVMDQILNDVNLAITLFPEAGFVNKSRASKPAAYALKTDALLWKAKVLGGGDAALNEAVTAADQAMASVSLDPVFANIFSTTTKNGPEIIFSLFFKKDEKSDHYGSTLKPRDLFVLDATNVNDIAFSRTGARSAYAPSAKFRALFTNAADVRKAGSYIVAAAANGSTIGIFDNKFRGTAIAGDDRYWENDIIVYRLAEIILFKAEALAALNRVPEAINELNKVRNRAKIGDYPGSITKLAVETEILDERFRELYLELKRWPDLIRFHKAGTINIYNEVPNLGAKGNMPLFFPIPRTQIDLNPNLIQTLGY